MLSRWKFQIHEEDNLEIPIHLLSLTLFQIPVLWQMTVAFQMGHIYWIYIEVLFQTEENLKLATSKCPSEWKILKGKTDGQCRHPWSFAQGMCLCQRITTGGFEFDFKHAFSISLMYSMSKWASKKTFLHILVIWRLFNIERLSTTWIIRLLFPPKANLLLWLSLGHYWGELWPITRRKNLLSDITDCSRVGRAEQHQPEKNSARQNECQWLCTALFMAGLVKCQKLYPRETVLTLVLVLNL